MTRSKNFTRSSSSDFEGIANDITMAVWNRIAELPAFQHLQPKDYPRLFETIQRVLKPYRISN